MTNQETFDTVAKHLLTQGAAAMNKEAECCYLTEYGTKCAVGCLIKEEDYYVEMEGLVIGELAKEGFCPDYIKELDLGLLSELQSIHDLESPKDWEKKLRKSANNFNLEWNQ